MEVRIARALGLGVAMAVSLWACSAGPDGGGAMGGGGRAAPAADGDLRRLPGTVYDVTLGPMTVAIDAATAGRAVRGISEDNDVFVFDAADARAQRLAVGTILLLEGVALRKIVAVERDGDALVVGTVEATLPEAIQSGTMKWNVPVRFGSPLARLRERSESPGSLLGLLAGGWLAPVRLDAAAGNYEKSGKLSGWDYKITSVPGPDRLDVNLYARKEVKGLSVELHGVGHLKDFETQATIEIADSALKYFDYSNKNLNGEMSFEWVAAREGNAEPLKGPDAMFKFPASFSMPLPIGGIPFVLEVTEALLIEPAFGEKREMGRGSFKVSYNGVSGFGIKGDEPTAKAKLAATSSIGDVISVSMVPSGVIIGAVAPKIELKLGAANGLEWLKKIAPGTTALTAAKALEKTTILGKINDAIAGIGTTLKKNEAAAHVSVTTMYVMASSGPFSLIPCQKTTLTVFGKAGAGAKIMGVKVGEKSVDVFKQEFKRLVPDRKACDF